MAAYKNVSFYNANFDTMCKYKPVMFIIQWHTYTQAHAYADTRTHKRNINKYTFCDMVLFLLMEVPFCDLNTLPSCYTAKLTEVLVYLSKVQLNFIP